VSKLTTIHDPDWSIEDYAAAVELEYNPSAKPTMVWTDVETTGLSKKGESKMLELALGLTDDDGVLVDVFQSFTKDMYTYQAISNMNDFVRDMHRESGFMEEWEQYIENPDMPSFEVSSVEDNVLAWLEYHHLLREPNTFEMCGNTINFDRKILEQEMPSLENWFFHRNIDISTIKQLCKKHNPRIAAHWKDLEPAIKPHRSLLDIAASIREYRFYVENFLWVAK
jgi:oligoribonuclease